ncbi:hypothetical protein Taro_043074 [Colocasia esculenta]|uniref:F-box domain-containing protein n=1 Tax=Colocasia esculenta TaxID=4460 RepID=A0A843WZX0_COLES|nr:hypothetical protein [Colocasia esculenta]
MGLSMHREPRRTRSGIRPWAPRSALSFPSRFATSLFLPQISYAVLLRSNVSRSTSVMVLHVIPLCRSTYRLPIGCFYRAPAQEPIPVLPLSSGPSTSSPTRLRPRPPPPFAFPPSLLLFCHTRPSSQATSTPAMEALVSKRPCCASEAARSPAAPAAAAAAEVAMVPGASGNPKPTDQLLEALLGEPGCSSAEVEISVERLVESRVCDSEKDRAIDGTVRLGEALLAAAKRCARRLATRHNSASWPLPPDLTIKVFSMLDTQSVCHAAATCSMFNKCANDPLCYANVDLTSVVPKVNNAVVCTMVQRAGQNLRSLKLGIWPSPNASLSMEPSRSSYYTLRNPIDAALISWNEKKPRQGKESSVLTRSCLLCLSMDGGAAGSLLRTLHLYNIDKMDSAALCTALSACQSLLDLEVVGIHIELRQTLESVYTHCHLIERLFLESSRNGRDDSLKSATCFDLVHSCPNLSFLALRGFKLHDQKARILVKGFRKLKLVDFSTSYPITGSFLRNLGGCASVLEVLVLRDCLHLKEDISNKDGLAAEEDWYRRCYNISNLLIAQLMEERPDMCLVADFPTDERFADVDQMADSDVNSEISVPSQVISLTSDSSLLSSSDSSDTSDQGSGNDDTPEITFAAFVDNLDDMDFLAWIVILNH